MSHRRDDPVSGVSSGTFLILLALFYLMNPNLLDEVNSFFHDFKLVQISQNLWWFMPLNNHPVLYNAASQFCYLFAMVHVVILVLRFAKSSPIRGKVKSLSSIIFWLGAGYVFGLISSGAIAWLSFIAALIILLGISILVRSTILLFVFRHARSLRSSSADHARL